MFLSLLSWSGTLLLAHDGVPSRERLETFVWRLALGGGVLALLGIAQFFLRQSFADRISIPGLTAIGGTGIGFRNGLVRPAGTATSPIEYGALLSILLPLALHVGFHHRHRALVMRWMPAVAIGGVIAISSSRTAYLGAVIGVAACMIAWTRRQRRVVLLLGLAGLTVISVAMPQLLKSVTSMFTGAEEDPSIESRTGSYDTAWAFLGHHPFFGRGLGTFLPKYRIFDNEYLQLLVCVGVVGTIAFLGLLVAAIYQLTRLFRHAADAGAKDLAVALVGATVAGFASLAFFDAFAFPMTMGTLFLVLGVAGAAGRLATAPTASGSVSGLHAAGRPEGAVPVRGKRELAPR
jgi:polysaccharide biosynthesis protein PslJ